VYVDVILLEDRTNHSIKMANRCYEEVENFLYLGITFNRSKLFARRD
jgi:hypothetical protein